MDLFSFWVTIAGWILFYPINLIQSSNLSLISFVGWKIHSKFVQRVPWGKTVELRGFLWIFRWQRLVRNLCSPTKIWSFPPKLFLGSYYVSFWDILSRVWDAPWCYAAFLKGNFNQLWLKYFRRFWNQVIVWLDGVDPEKLKIPFSAFIANNVQHSCCFAAVGNSIPRVGL